MFLYAQLHMHQKTTRIHDSTAFYLQSSQRHHGPLFSQQTSLQKSFPSPLTPLLLVPSHIPSLFLHLSTAYFSRHCLSPQICLSSLAAAAGCSLEPESHPASPSPPRVHAKTKGQGCLSEHCPLPPCAAVHLQRRE